MASDQIQGQIQEQFHEMRMFESSRVFVHVNVCVARRMWRVEMSAPAASHGQVGSATSAMTAQVTTKTSHPFPVKY
jgi:hypothetical protein